MMAVLRKTTLNQRYLLLTSLGLMEALRDANPTKKTSIVMKLKLLSPYY